MTDGLGEGDILRFRMLADPQLSPDGSQVAFVLIEQDAAADRQVNSIWDVPTDGSAAPRRLTAGPSDSHPRWDPGGGRLAFLGAREREWAKDLFQIDMRGGEGQRVASLPRGAVDFAWSADGSRFCLVGGPEYPPDPDRGEPGSPEEARRRYLERVRHIRRFRYRLDGQGQLDDEPHQLWVVGAAGEGLRMITDGPSQVARPRWIPDGRIAFLSNREPDFDRSEVTEIYAVAPEGGEVARLSSLETSMSGFGIAPDGALATLRADHAEPFDALHHRVWIGDDCLTREMDRTSSAVVLGDTMPPREAIEPTWAGGRLYFEVADAGCQHVYRARPGDRPEVVVGGRRVLGGFSTNGELAAFLSSAPGDALSLRVCAAGGDEERVIFDPNPWLAEKALGELRELGFEHDGERLDAWAMLPPGGGGEPGPTLLYIHGGPHAAYGWSFQFIFHVLAGAGYTVVFCNPPGSQSYRQEFAERLRGHWGELDFPCFMALVDRAVDAGLADPDRLGVGGASYGGYSTLWAIGHTNRFRAAVAARPVAALRGFYGSSDVGWNFLPAEMGAEPWDDPELYTRLSPVIYLDSVETPLRLIASTGDLRTPLEQAENVFARLHKMGKEVDLLIFSGEPHAIVLVGRPWNRVRHMRAVVDWFDRYLQPALEGAR
ncbi:MAG: S9 family peptidase, partial [Candidatus Dormibacteraeota bacterium]|nr:S9 family peptidase [Candidatus Dormibacteraeota bacterium]